MRIDNHGNLEATDVSTRSVSQPDSSSQQAVQIAAQPTTEDSTYQSAVSALVAQVNRQPEIRQEKVAALAQQVRAGTHDIAPSETAEAIFADLAPKQAA
jgi:anti-sigma28 factor (negative regulator of flagellin synthesis)